MMGDLAEEESDPKRVVVDEPICAEELVTLDEHGPGALKPRPLPGPKEMSAIERGKHYAAGHLPYDPRCEICLRCERPNDPHHSKGHESERTIPLLVGNYGFVKDGSDDEKTTMPDMKSTLTNLRLLAWLQARVPTHEWLRDCAGSSWSVDWCISHIDPIESLQL